MKPTAKNEKYKEVATAKKSKQQSEGEQGGGDAQMQKIIEQVMQMLQQGVPPEQIIQKLVSAGIPEEQATKLVQQVQAQMQQQQQGGQQPQGGQQQMM